MNPWRVLTTLSGRQNKILIQSFRFPCSYIISNRSGLLQTESSPFDVERNDVMRTGAIVEAIFSVKILHSKNKII